MDSENEDARSGDSSSDQQQAEASASKSQFGPNVVVNPEPKPGGKTSGAGKSATEAQKETLERIGLKIACIVAFATIGQWVTNSCNNSATATQTDKLIQAANSNACAAQKIADASQKNAKAAESFATSAGFINQGVDNAVTKLDAQAKATQKSADAAKSSAETASKQLELSERPLIRVSNPSSGPWKAYKGGNLDALIHIDVENIGSMPARIDAFFLDFPESGRDTATVHDMCTNHGATRHPNQHGVLFKGEQLFPPGTYQGIPKNISNEQVLYLPSLIVGCVRYKSLITGEAYYTGFIFNVSSSLPPIPITQGHPIEIPAAAIIVTPDKSAEVDIK